MLRIFYKDNQMHFRDYDSITELNVTEITLVYVFKVAGAA